MPTMQTLKTTTHDRDLNTKLQAHLRTDNPSMEHGDCAFCPPTQVARAARATIPLLVRDPDNRGYEEMVDAPACSDCHAKLVPRIRADLPRDLARVLVRDHIVDLEAYQRPILDAPVVTRAIPAST